MGGFRPTGTYAVYRGIEYRLTFADDHEAGLMLGDRPAPDGLAVREVWNPPQRTVRVPTAELERHEQVRTTGRYAGTELLLLGSERAGPAAVTIGTDGDRVTCYFVGDPDWAIVHDFTGDQHDGWYGEVDAAQLTDIAERITDLQRPDRLLP